MTIYTVHPARAAGRFPAPPDAVALTPESFSWAALIFGPLWLACHRLWLWLAGWILIAALLAFGAASLAGRVGAGSLGLALLLAQILFAFEAQNLRRRTLERRGRRAMAVVVARGADDAAARFFVRLAAGQSAAVTRETTGRDDGRRQPPPLPPAPTSEGFLTLFPDGSPS